MKRCVTATIRTALLVVALSVAWADDSRAASNLDLSKSNVNRVLLRGKLLTASVDIEGESTRIVYKTPAEGDFVLTQVCVGRTEAGVLLQVDGSTLVHLGSGVCQSFTPGLVIAPDKEIFCSAAADTFCTITGLLNEAPPVATPRP